MVEPIPFFGLFDDGQDATVYLRKQLEMQQKLISELQEALTRAQQQIAALSVPGLWEHQDYGWEMIRNEDGTFTVKPIPEEK